MSGFVKNFVKSFVGSTYNIKTQLFSVVSLAKFSQDFGIILFKKILVDFNTKTNPINKIDGYYKFLCKILMCTNFVRNLLLGNTSKIRHCHLLWLTFVTKKKSLSTTFQLERCKLRQTKQLMRVLQIQKLYSKVQILDRNQLKILLFMIIEVCRHNKSYQSFDFQNLISLY